MFVSKYVTFIKKKFILERGSGRIVELREVQDLQIIPLQPVDSPHNDPNQMCPLLRCSHDTHILSEDHLKCVVYYSYMILS